MVEEKYLLKDNVAGILFTCDELKEYVELVVAKALDIDVNLIKGNLVLKSPRINVNSNIKSSTVDAIYETNDDVVNIEINYNFSKNAEVKNMRYVCHLLLNQIKKSDKDKIKKISQININNYDFFNKGKFIYRSFIMEEKLHEIRDDYITIIDINVDFLSKIDYTKIKEEENDSLEKLLYVFVCNNKNKLDEVYVGDDIMEKVRDKISSLTDDFADDLYYDREEFINECSKEIGEREARQEIAKNMLDKNFDLNAVSDITGLSLKDIKSLKENDEK